MKNKVLTFEEFRKKQPKYFKTIDLFEEEIGIENTIDYIESLITKAKELGAEDVYITEETDQDRDYLSTKISFFKKVHETDDEFESRVKRNYEDYLKELIRAEERQNNLDKSERELYLRLKNKFESKK
jgi:hypothetical protein